MLFSLSKLIVGVVGFDALCDLRPRRVADVFVFGRLTLFRILKIEAYFLAQA